MIFLKYFDIIDVSISQEATNKSGQIQRIKQYWNVSGTQVSASCFKK